MSPLNFPACRLFEFDAVQTYQLSDTLYCSGQLSAEDIQRLAQLGIQLVINLALVDTPGALANETALITQQGISYLQIPVQWERPQQHQLQQFLSILRSLGRQKVWLHCAKNMRASAFIYLYRRLVLHESEGAASYPMCEIWQANAIWQQFIQEALNTDTRVNLTLPH